MIKKILPYLATFYLLLSTIGVAFAYTSEDIARANTLSQANIIVDQSETPENYRLDAPISRQEVIGMALKLGGFALPHEYACKGYFLDAVFRSSHSDAWVCRALEIGADKGLVSRYNKNARPKDTITKAESLAIAWNALDLDIDTSLRDTHFFDGDTPAAAWQEALLHTAWESGIIVPTTLDGKLLWNHNAFATRKVVFEIFSSLLDLRNIREKTMYLEFSDETSKYSKISLLPRSAKIRELITQGRAEEALKALDLNPISYRVEGSVIFFMELSDDLWGHVRFGAITTDEARIYKLENSYNPYNEAMAAMLAKFQIASELDFYTLPYGETWEATRDFIETYYKEKFMGAPIIYSSNK